MPKIFTFTLALLVSLMQSCGNKSTNQTSVTTSLSNPAPQVVASAVKLEQPLNGSTFTPNQNVDIRYKLMSDTLTADSAVLLINGKRVTAFNGAQHSLPLQQSKMGMQRAILNVYSLGKSIGNMQFVYTVKPQHPPKLYTYKVIKEYAHATDAYTQGLFFHNGFLYEGTGEYGKSTLRKVDLQTGNVLQSINLDSKYFGEGIALLNNRIYQLTWQNRVGFIYNADTFEKIGEFNYATEGWGITTDGKQLIMSDGSANIYFIDPSTMAIVNQIQVYSNEGGVEWINELEYINGEIWANIYEDDKVVRINPQTGEVTAIINLEGILKPADRTRDTNVLNGIAYDPATGRIFVTGKNWAKLFEIKLVEK